MLVVVFAVVLLGLRFADGAEREAVQVRLDADATNLTEHMNGTLRGLSGTGVAMAGLLGSLGPERQAGGLNQQWFSAFAGPLVADGQASLLAFAPYVPATQLDSFNDRVRHEGKLDFAVFELVEGQPEPATGRDAYVPVQYIEPFNANVLTVGYDLASDPVVRAATLAGRDSGAVRTTTPHMLPSGPLSLLIVPVYDGPVPATTEARRQQFVGAAVIGYRPQELLDRLVRDGLVPPGLGVGLTDALAGSTAPLLASLPSAIGSPDPSAPSMTTSVQVAAHRDLTLTDDDPLYRVAFAPGAAYVEAGRSSLSLIVIIIGLLMVVALAFGYGLLRRRSNLDLLGLADRLASVLRASPDAFVGLDREGRIVEWSVHAQQLFGWSREEATGSALSTLIGIDGPEPATALIAPLGARERRRIECDARTRTGAVIPVEIQVSDRRQPERWSLSCFIRDVTERKRAQQALLRARQMETVDNMARELTHDFNNLLTIVMGSLDLVSAEPSLSPIGKRRLGTAMTAALRGADLTRSLMYVSRANRLDPVEIDVARLLGELEPLVRQALGPEHKLRLDVDEEPLLAYMDPGGLSNALLNLVINARDAMPEAGRLTIRATPEVGDPATPPGRVVIEVSDTGTGMPPDVVERAFEPFFTTKPLGKGTGLGLATVHGFVARSGGDVAIESVVGAGTTVTMRLVAAPPASENIPVSGVAERAIGVGQILVVDDEDAVREMAVAWLTELGHRVDEANSGEAALHRLREGEHSLLVTDVVMSGTIDGLELARRARVLLPSLRVVIATGFAGTGAEAAAHEAGFRVILKPYGRSELTRAVEETLASPIGGRREVGPGREIGEPDPMGASAPS